MDTEYFPGSKVRCWIIKYETLKGRQRRMDDTAGTFNTERASSSDNLSMVNKPEWQILRFI